MWNHLLSGPCCVHRRGDQEGADQPLHVALLSNKLPRFPVFVFVYTVFVFDSLPYLATNFPGSQNAAPPAPNAPVQPAFSGQNRWKHDIYIWHSLWRAVTNSTITFVFSFQSGQSLAGQGFAGAALWLSRTRLRKIEPLQTRSLWIWSSCRKNRPGGAKRAGASPAKG